MKLIDVTKQFANAETCVRYLSAIRWPDGVRCLMCGSPEVTFMATKSKPNKKGEQKTRFIYQCRACKVQFTPTTGTLFNDTHLDLAKWFMAVALMVNAKKGLSALQLKRDLGVAYKTAWYLNHRIREAMSLFERATGEPLTGTIEVDEAYMGSKTYDPRRKRAPRQSAGVRHGGARWQGADVPRHAHEPAQCHRQDQRQYLDYRRCGLHR